MVRERERVVERKGENGKRKQRERRRNTDTSGNKHHKNCHRFFKNNSFDLITNYIYN